MYEIEFIYYVSITILNVLIISGFVWFIMNLICVWKYERKINRLYNELEEKIKIAKDQRIVMAIIEGQIKKLKDEYEPRIEELKRKRQFILDKLPFVK